MLVARVEQGLSQVFKHVVVVGLTEKNVEWLREGKEIMVDSQSDMAAMPAGDLAVLIMVRETHQDLVEDLLGVIDETTMSLSKMPWDE